MVGGAFVNIYGDHESLQDLGSDPNRQVIRDMSGPRPDFMERSSRFRYKVTYLPREHPKMLAVDAITKSPEFRSTAQAPAPTVSAVLPRRHAASVPPPSPASAPSLPASALARTDSAIIAASVSSLIITAPDRTSASTWRGRQLRDPQYLTLINFLETGVLPVDTTPQRAKGLAAQAAHYQLVDGALYHIRVTKGKTEIQLSIPNVDSFREERLRAAHEVDSVHEGPKKMFERLCVTFHWDGMLDSCIKFFSSCDPCASNTVINNNYGLLDPTTSAKLAGRDRMGLDLAGPFKKTADGNTFVGISVNYRSGRVITFPLKDKEDATVIQALRSHVIPFTGVPEDLVTDRAPEFGSELPRALYASFGIVKQTSTGGHPQTDGMAEAGVKLAKAKYRILTQIKADDFDKFIGDVNMSLASEFKLPNGMSPYKAETGRDFRSPSFFQYPLAELGVDHPAIKDLADLHKQLEKARGTAAAKMKERYDVGRVPAPFKAGDLVWLRNQNPETTLDPRRIGPFRIESSVGSLAARLSDLPQGPQIGRRHPVVSVADLEFYHGVLKTPTINTHVLKQILQHKLVSRGKKGKKREVTRYKVRWHDDSETWEPARNLIDEETDGLVINKSLQDYWQHHPQLRTADGY